MPELECFQAPGTYSGRTSVRSCQPTLDKLAAFQGYKLIQLFQTKVSPNQPKTPPYIVTTDEGDCAICINANENPREPDEFSFEQAGELAVHIMDVCQGDPRLGRGGKAVIGPRKIWSVTVRGFGPQTSLEEIERELGDDAVKDF